MKINKLLTINGTEYQVVSDNVRLGLFNAGRALFKVKSDVALTGLVKFSIGNDAQNLTPFFLGYIETSSTVDELQQAVFCRELGGAMNQLMPISLRHCTLTELLITVNNISKIPFSPANADYSNKPVSAIHHMGIGYHLFDQIGHIFDIQQYIWQQQADGSIFVGSWVDSVFATRPIDIPQKFMKSAGIGNKAKIPALPALRPGTLFNGQYLTAIDFSGSEMQLTWNKNPWLNR
jgi:hypothetical protein